MGLHRHGTAGHTLMKMATVALLTCIQLATGKTPAELEAEYSLGLRCEFELKTGQTWRRLTNPVQSDALSLDNYFRIASLALRNRVVKFSDGEKYRLGLLGWSHLRLVDGTGWQAYLDLKSALDAEQKAVRIFDEGVDRMLHGRSPMAKGVTGRGRPGVPSTDAEAHSAYKNWRATLANLGADVVEAQDLGDLEIYTTAAHDMPPDVTHSELVRLRAALLPEFDAAELAGPRPLTVGFIHSVKRLRLIFKRSGSNAPLFPGPLNSSPSEYALPTLPISDTASLTEQDVTGFFHTLQACMRAEALDPSR